MEEEKKEYIIYKLMKQRDIGASDLHRTLKKVGVVVSPRTLHKYVLKDFEKVKDDKLKIVALEMIKSYDKMISNLKEKFKHG